jgi:mannose-1-phosphate guanylyltransferase/phosphomannomutase
MQLITTTLDAQMGVHLTPGGERIIVVDDKGCLLNGVAISAVMVELALRDAPGSTVAIPVNLPSIFETIAARYDGKIIRTDMESDALINATYSKNVILGANGKGNFIFPDFQCAFDGMMAIAKMLEYLATQQVSLSDIAMNLPSYHVASRRVSCVWDIKPKVMRLLIEKFDNYQNHATNGIKVYLDDCTWVLILPDPDQPYFQITTEARSQADAEALADEYAQIIETISPLE